MVPRQSARWVRYLEDRHSRGVGPGHFGGTRERPSLRTWSGSWAIGSLRVPHRPPALPKAKGSAACLEAPASDAWARDSRGREWSAELGRSQGQPRRWCCFYLRMADVPDFDLVPMIIGRGGRNTRDIAAAADAKVVMGG